MVFIFCVCGCSLALMGFLLRIFVPSFPLDPNEVDPYEWQNRLEHLMQHGAQSGSTSTSYPLLSEVVTSQTMQNWTSGGSSSFSSRRRRLDDLITPLDANASNVLDSKGNPNNQLSSWSPLSSTHSVPSPSDGSKAGPEHQQRSNATDMGTVRNLGPSTVLSNEYRAVEGGDYSDDDGSDGLSQIGQLSIDDHSDVRYHGHTSGLHLLASASAKAMQSDKHEQPSQSTGSPS